MKVYKVKENPIYKGGKLYQKGEEYPFSKEDKHLLWNLDVTEVKKKKQTSSIEEQYEEIEKELNENEN
jgi:hypothetical protein